MMSERSIRWGVLPRYFGYRGDLVETQPHIEDAILAAMGATSDHPPRVRRRAIPPARCALDRNASRVMPAAVRRRAAA